MIDDVKTIGAIAATLGSSAGAGSITVATITTSAPGILGAIGLTTTSTITLPIAGVVGVGALAGYSVYKGIQVAKKFTKPKTNIQ